MSDEPSKIRFQYVFPEGYSPVAVNGAHGGLTPRGDILMHLYFEWPAVPEVIEHDVHADGRLGPFHVPAEQLQKPQFLRTISGGAVLSLKSATEIRDWLTRQIEQAKRGENAPDPSAGGSSDIRQ